MFGVAFEPSTLLDESAVPPPLPACHDPFPELTRSPLQANGREHPCGFPPSGWGRTCSGDQMVWLKTRVTLYHRVGQEGKSGWMPQGKRIWPEEVQRTSLYEDGIARMDGFLQLQSLHRGKKVRRTWGPMHMRLPCGIPWGRECAITAKRHPRISGWRLAVVRRSQDQSDRSTIPFRSSGSSMRKNHGTGIDSPASLGFNNTPRLPTLASGASDPSSALKSARS